eukprot:213598-Hanusia_phi.AAC.2
MSAALSISSRYLEGSEQEEQEGLSRRLPEASVPVPPPPNASHATCSYAWGLRWVGAALADGPCGSCADGSVRGHCQARALSSSPSTSETRRVQASLPSP